MKIQGEYEFAASRERVWEALLDVDVLASTLPGFQKLEQVGENEFAGALSLGVGPVQGRFEGRLQLANLKPPESYELQLSGRGAPGFVEGSGTIILEGEGEATRLSYDLEMKIGGRVAGVGQRLLDMSAKMITKQALGNLARRIESSGD